MLKPNIPVINKISNHKYRCDYCGSTGYVADPGDPHDAVPCDMCLVEYDRHKKSQAYWRQRFFDWFNGKALDEPAYTDEIDISNPPLTLWPEGGATDECL